MRELATRYKPLETGGMFIGYEAGDQQVVVTTVIGPGPNARHRRLRFRPDYDHQQHQLEAHFARTQGRETYLGDWHTHPFGACALSWLDRRVLVRIARSASSGASRPIMAVLAGGNPDWNLHASRLTRFRRGFFEKAELSEMTPRVFSAE